MTKRPERTAAQLRRRRKHPEIVGWAVHTKGINQAAMYNIDQKDQAFDAAKRWGASISALVLHPEVPQ